MDLPGLWSQISKLTIYTTGRIGEKAKRCAKAELDPWSSVILLDCSSPLPLICIAHSNPSTATKTLYQLHSPASLPRASCQVLPTSNKQKTPIVTGGRAEPFLGIGKGKQDIPVNAFSISSFQTDKRSCAVSDCCSQFSSLLLLCLVLWKQAGCWGKLY